MWKDRVKEIVGEEKAQEVIDSISKGMDNANTGILYNILAPIVVPFALIGTKWESEKLPSWARKWDNNVNLNGDSGDWLDLDGDGISDTIFMPLEDTPEVRKRCYWAIFGMKGKVHPRSSFARWCWIGLRNRAKWVDVEKGIEIDYWNTELTAYSKLSDDGTLETVSERQGLWHYHRQTPFKRKWKIVEQRGWKVHNVNQIDTVAIPVSYRAIKSQ